MTVVLVEAEKSVLALTAVAARADRAMLPIALGGCWGWRGRIGRTTDSSGARVDEYGAVSDLDLVTWGDRDVVVMLDGDVVANHSVQAARRGLADELTRRGARVRIADVPTSDGINGPDDYIGRHGDAALFALLDAAKPARRSQNVPIADLLSEFDLTADAVRDITPDVLGERLRALAVALTGADPLRRALVATELKKTAKIPATIVTAALGTCDDETEKQTANTITLADDEPAAKPVNGAALLDETSALIRRHIVLNEARADAITLWIAAAYAIDALALMPILLITSPAMRSGKTTLLTLLGAILPRALTASNLTGAVLARAIAAFGPTLLADEADTWLTDEASELRGIMNAGHTRPTSFAPGQGQEFSVLLGFPGARGPRYPIVGFPRIAEFRTMLADLLADRATGDWTGAYFYAGVTSPTAKEVSEIWFRAHDNGISFGFTVKEWRTVHTLFRRAWELPDIRRAWDALLLEYGEL